MTWLRAWRITASRWLHHPPVPVLVVLAVAYFAVRAVRRVRHLGVALALAAVLSIFLRLCLAFNAATPVYEAFDENHHVAYITHVLETGEIPVLPSRLFEGHQPPLYYLIAAQYSRALALPFASQPDEPKAGNPKVYLFAHLMSDRWTCCGRVRTVRALRLLSTAFGLATLLVIFFVGLSLLPLRPWAAVAITATVAFLPQFIFLNSVVNNDPLAFLMGALVLLGVVRLAMAETPRERVVGAVIAGLAVGLGLLTKEYILALLPLLPVALLVSRPPWREALAVIAVVGLLALSIAGWYLARNLTLYGELWPFRAERASFGSILPQSIVNRTWDYPLFRGLFLQELRESFWYRGGWGQLRPPEWVYATLDLATLPVIAGAFVLVGNPARLGLTRRQAQAFALLLGAIGLQFAGVAWANLTVQQFQGRWLFPAMAAFAVVIVLGYRALLPRRAAALAYLVPPLGLLAITLAIFQGTVLHAYP